MTPDEPRSGADPVALLELPAARRRILVDTAPLREHRDFRLLWVGQGVTFLGSMVTYVAVPFQVYALTGSSGLVGLLGLVEFGAMILTAFVGGALADAVDRRRMVRLTEAALLLGSVGLLLNARREHPSVAALFVLVGLLTAFDCLQRPSLDALLPRLVPTGQLVAAAALNSFRMTVGMIAGPALGGLLVSTLGLASTYAFDVGTFAVSLVALQLMRAVPPPPDAERPSVRGVLDGLRYARSRPELMGTYLVDINAMFFGMPNALFPALAAGYGGASVLGLLYAAPAVGALVASTTSGWTGRVHRHGLAVLWSAGLWGVAIVGFGLSSWLWLALVFLALAGAADMVSGIFRSTIWNTTIPDHLRGRLAGIELVSYSSGPTLGNVEAGAVAQVTGPRFSVGFGGVMCVAGTLALAAALPAFRGYSSRAEPDAAGEGVGLGEDDPDGLPER
jgi:MFS family permease